MGRKKQAKAPGQALVRRVGLSSLEEARLRRSLRRTAPSEPWVDAQIKECTDANSRGERIVYRFHDARAFPPGGSQTAMVRCPRCGVFTPPNTIEHGVCLDHADSRGWGPSPSAAAIRGLQLLNLRLVDATLPSESMTDLRREIQRFEKRSAAGAGRGDRARGRVEK